jgi:hypothetical protein
VDDVSINVSLKLPAMYLAGYHKIYLVRLHAKPDKVYQVIAKTLYQQVLLGITTIANGANIINW